MTQHTMEDTIHVLQNRILQDKQQLKHLQSLLYPSSTVQEAPEKAYRHRHHHMETTGYGEPQDPTSESIHVRSNPIFQSNFDAMDTYDEECMRRIKQRRTIHQPSHAAAGRHHAMQHLFHQCRKRIGRAEKLLDRACSEVRPCDDEPPHTIVP